MDIIAFKPSMQQSLEDFFIKCFSAIGIPYSPNDRHSDIANVKQHYMKNGCFWCLFNNEILIGTIALRTIDIENNTAELKRMFVLPEYQGKGYGRLLLNYAIDYAKEHKYNKIFLDTRKQFSAAQHLYKSTGFRETEKYNDNDRAELYFELLL